MDSDELNLYKQQLLQVNEALLTCPKGPQRGELLNLRTNIEELLSLSSEKDETPSNFDGKMSDEFALFMSEMEEVGAVKSSKKSGISSSNKINCTKDIEGMKCMAPYKHQWGNIVYHNAMICSVLNDDSNDEMKVRVLYTNPTHQEMLPCPYYFDFDCKFSDEKCRFSHGDIVLYSSLKEYVPPKFDSLTTGSFVLAKQSDNLWYRAIIRELYDNKCLVRFESNKKDIEVVLEHVLPLDQEGLDGIIISENEDDDHDESKEDIINMSLLITPSDEALGNWEKYTRGMGSKLMQRMGYIVGTGLGKNAEGRIDPVTAIILPSGKSLDHCMNLREKAGGDKNLFSVEKKLKRLQKKQEQRNQRAYERKSKDKNVFNFLNRTLSDAEKRDSTKEHLEEQQRLKQHCSRSLNIRGLQLAESIRRAEKDLDKLKDSLGRNTGSTSNVNIKLRDKLLYGQDQLKMLQAQALMIKNEQNLRDNKKKLTIF